MNQAKVTEAEEKFLPEIWETIKLEFPYTSLTEQDFREKIGSGRAWVFSVGEKELEGFSEIEELGLRGQGRVNAIFVKPKFRRLGLGAKLLRHAIKFLSGRGTKKIVLVVSDSNIAGKKLYEKCGFRFKKKLGKKVGGMGAEQWEMEPR